MEPGLNTTKRPPAVAGGRADDVSDPTPVRLTSTPTVGTARTAAATAARRRAAAGRTALELACRLGDLDDERLVALASQLVIECVKRGVADRICA